MREAVVVASSRTPLAKSFRGSFNLTRPDDLAAHCIRDVLEQGAAARSRPRSDDVILGCGYPEGQQGMNVARIARHPRRPAGDRRRRDGQPLLLVGPAGDRHGGAPDHARRGRRRRSAAASRASPPSPGQDRSQDHDQSLGRGAQAGHLHGHGRHGRSRRQALQDQPRRRRTNTPCRASSARPGPRPRASSTKSWRR